MHVNRKPALFRPYARRNGLKSGVLRLFAGSSGLKDRYELTGNLKQKLIAYLITAGRAFRIDQLLQFERVV